MNNYYSLRIDATPCDADITDLLAAFLADAGYESFVADETGITAYVKEELYDPSEVKTILSDFPMEADFKWEAELIEGRDWNAEWEKNYFKPIVIAGQCVVRSTFHKDVPQARYEILIDPRMAFGTGHHATTTLMATRLLDNAALVKDAIVTDMGTGTGILAILASMLEAKVVTGIEIDPAAYDNAVDNTKLNATDVSLYLGGAECLDGLPQADILMANINRNIIIGDLHRYAAALRPEGRMWLSGFYPHDIPVIEDTAAKYGLHLTDTTTRGEWASAEFCRHS